jgi:hypothetical protein
MSKAKKPGRPPGKTVEEKPHVGYRLTKVEYDALVRFALSNDRTVAAESARAVKKYLRENGQLPEEK